ncbi:MAG: cyclic nucleotide-binding domain-containing protein [Ignavibacteriae bacterium]|nr:cyclic nucleotide-binding domain-containing protein [Ignavibacteriota bacterium]
MKKEDISLNELRNVIALSDLPDEHLQWILDHSVYNEYKDGTLIFKKGEPMDVMWILLEGKVTFYMEINGTQVHFYTFENEMSSGGIGGLIPYSRMKTSPGYAYAQGNVRRLELHKDHFHELELMNPDLIQRLIGYMTERARSFATVKLQHEKVSALGKLAAGIAHELNNPASAINRISSELGKRLTNNYQLTEDLLAHKINPDQLKFISYLVEAKNNDNDGKKKLTAIQRMELEDNIYDWLKKKGLSEDVIVGETFVESGFTSEDLESFCSVFEKESIKYVIKWLENLLSSKKILQDLDEASSRISNLVGAIKSHVHMDQSNELQPTDLNKDIDNTITLLGYKLREKNINVKKLYCENLADVPAYIGELNQVWTNLIDNSIYALDKNGEISIETKCNDNSVTVRFIDNGAGIPQDIQSRIFDPFFTTKKVGEGTGIGLDLVNRIIKHHNGEISVNSKPGRTEFIITLPIHEIK